MLGFKHEGHATFRATHAGRTPVVYVGANDGMLHAFNATNGRELMACIVPAITQPQYEALASWAYNVGTGAACKSTLVRKLNAGEMPSSWCPELLRWNRVQGRVVKGLTNRRQAELKVCLT